MDFLMGFTLRSRTTTFLQSPGPHMTRSQGCGNFSAAHIICSCSCHYITRKKPTKVISPTGPWNFKKFEKLKLSVSFFTSIKFKLVFIVKFKERQVMCVGMVVKFNFMLSPSVWEMLS